MFIDVSNLKKLSLPELDELCYQLRNRIISTCFNRGGHLGASLGAIEVAVALHRVFESPKEGIIWDVGHQAYAHKLLTGRDNNFDKLRTQEGPSGFLRISESNHDLYGAGHSSTSLSLAIGHSYQNPNWTVAVIGDGALTAGVALEALNNLGTPRLGPLLIVLNDNQQSIGKNTGELSKILSNPETAKKYFELFGCDYIGPINGHQLSALIPTLEQIKNSQPKNPLVLHVLTEKGHGYPPAENEPEKFHGISPQGAPQSSSSVSWSQFFGNWICEAAKKDPKIVAITAAMSDGTGLKKFSFLFPDRFFDVGIAEPHAVTFAAALAKRGFKPYVAIYSTFMQRALDPLIHDIALQKLPVRFIWDRAGFVGADGPTHHGSFDIAYAMMTTNLQSYAPYSESSFMEALELSLNSQLQGPLSIRIPRGNISSEKTFSSSSTSSHPKGLFEIHSAIQPLKRILMVLGHAAQKIYTLPREITESSTVIVLNQFKPLPEGLKVWLEANKNSSLPFYLIENGVESGSFSQWLVSKFHQYYNFKIFAYSNPFVEHGTVEEQEKFLERDTEALIRFIHNEA